MKEDGANRLVRRDFLRLSSGLAATALLSNSLWGRALAAPVQAGPGPYGPLLPPDANGVMLPEGFSARMIAQAGQRVGSTDYRWHVYPDGGATFASSDGGYIYVSNSEMVLTGGTSAIRFDAAGQITSAYRDAAQLCWRQDALGKLADVRRVYGGARVGVLSRARELSSAPAWARHIQARGRGGRS